VHKFISIKKILALISYSFTLKKQRNLFQISDFGFQIPILYSHIQEADSKITNLPAGRQVSNHKYF